MSTYQTEEEQVEAIKKWWKDNGKSVIGGIVLGFAVIGGWQGWKLYQKNQGEAASSYFDAMRNSVRIGQIDAAIEDGKRLIGDYGSTAYASFAALELAKLSYDRGEKAAARDQLHWVTESAPDPSIRELARLRLGQLLLDMNELPALQALLGQPPLAAFAGEFSSLRGDLERALGNQSAAREAYQEALLKGVQDEGLLRMKLVDVGGVSPAS
jgi:predicted negative regulator of RcsB-dependent stress response